MEVPLDGRILAWSLWAHSEEEAQGGEGGGSVVLSCGERAANEEEEAVPGCREGEPAAADAWQ